MTLERELDWLQSAAGVLDLDDREILVVSGDDAHEWLQGQITNQLTGVDPAGSVYAFVLTPKGRVLADVWVLVRDDELWLDVPSSQVDMLLERFDRYIIMEDVEIEHRDDLRIITAQGPKAGDVADGGWPSNRLGTGGRQWVLPSAELEAELARLATRCGELGGGRITKQAWTHAHVLRGRPRFGVDFGEWTYPQESGLKPVAVSFEKGCYIGQETVVMLENRGKAPKVLWRWEVDTSDPPAAETPIMAGETPVGQITSAVNHGDASRALGYLKRGHEANGALGFTIDGAQARALGPVEEGPGSALSDDT